LAPLPDVDGAIEHALEHPLGCDPLSAQLRPGMKVTIAFDDISLPLPPMQRPDIRQRVIEIVLSKLATRGVTDIHLIAATSLHRRLTARELRRILGKKVFNQFYPDRLYNHDAEDKERIVFLGKTEQGEVVEINRRCVESDLLIYVNINLVSMDGGHKSVPVGLTTYRSLRHHHNVHTMLHSCSYMDPPRSALHHSCNRMGKVVNEHINIFTIETTLNSDTFPHLLTFLQKPEHRYNPFDRLNLRLNKATLDLLPQEINRKIFSLISAPYGVTGIHAGKTDPVHEKTLENIYRQQLVPVRGQADILLVGLPYLCPYNVNSIMNPILVMCLGLGYTFNFYRNKPLVREGGVMIFFHPLEYKFHPVHHPSYIDFFEQVLPHTTDPAEIEQKYEESFAHNPRYIQAYRYSYAYHGVHPFYMWYWGAYALRYLRRVIFVHPRSPEAAHRMGFETASTLEEAIALAQEVTGSRAALTYFHYPPIFMCDVE
ncbi:MAG: DUF2088 domain-containing protein, partial [Nitrospinota bacterium]